MTKISLNKLIAVASIVLIAGCGGSNSQSSNKEEKTSIPPKPPAISLFDASAKGDLDAVKQHIAAGTDLNQLDPNEQGSKDSAPKIVAMGQRKIAERIREVAKEAGVPIIQNKPLARNLFKSLKVGMEIPAIFYQAVAEILAKVFTMKKKR